MLHVFRNGFCFYCFRVSGEEWKGQKVSSPQLCFIYKILSCKWSKVIIFVVTLGPTRLVFLRLRSVAESVILDCNIIFDVVPVNCLRTPNNV